jgi:hypothetical protein
VSFTGVRREPAPSIIGGRPPVPPSPGHRPVTPSSQRIRRQHHCPVGVMVAFAVVDGVARRAVVRSLGCDHVACFASARRGCCAPAQLVAVINSMIAAPSAHRTSSSQSEAQVPTPGQRPSPAHSPVPARTGSPPARETNDQRRTSKEGRDRLPQMTGLLRKTERACGCSECQAKNGPAGTSAPAVATAGLAVVTAPRWACRPEHSQEAQTWKGP